MSRNRAKALSDIDNELDRNAVEGSLEYRDNGGTPVKQSLISPPGTESTKVEIEDSATVGDSTETDSRTIQIPSVIHDRTDQFYDAVRRAYRRGRRALENAPTPGGILVPLTILFVFVMILLPVNGHTRLMWLWLALTGNAEIGPPLTPPTLNPASSTTIGGSPTSSTNPNTGTGGTKNAASTGTVPLVMTSNVSTAKASSSAAHTANVAAKPTHATTVVHKATVNKSTGHVGAGGSPIIPLVDDRIHSSYSDRLERLS